MSITALAMCLFRYKGRILVSSGYDSVRGSHYWRPLGGHVEFGEPSRTTIIREIKEEIGADIINVQQLGVLENIFHFCGKLNHEIVFIYDAEFVDLRFYQKESIECIEGYHPFTATWRAINEFDNQQRLVPEGLAAFL